MPFTPESRASTVFDTGSFRACWYRRSFAVPSSQPGDRLLLHFGAVDYEATVWCNGRLAGGHEGGYAPFTVDITSFAADGPELAIVVRAFDDP